MEFVVDGVDAASETNTLAFIVLPTCSKANPVECIPWLMIPVFVVSLQSLDLS